MRRLKFGLLAAMMLFAQDSTPPESISPDQAVVRASRWVRDEDPRSRALAAYWAGRDGLTSLIPPLIENLATYPAGNDAVTSWFHIPPDDAAIQSVADALIRLNAGAPVDAIMKLYPKFPVQALILLAKSEDDNSQALYRIFNDTKNDPKFTNVWLGAANLLAARRPELIARQLLEKFTLAVNITVVNPGTRRRETGSTAPGCAWDGIAGPPYVSGWPAIREYELTTDRTDHLVAPGPASVYFAYRESADYIPRGESDPCRAGLEPVFALGLLEKLAGSAQGGLALHPEVSEVVEFTSELQYRAEVQMFLSQLKQPFDQLIRKFVKDGLLTAGDAGGVRLHIDLLIDNRTSRRATLPAIDVTRSGMIARPSEIRR